MQIQDEEKDKAGKAGLWAVVALKSPDTAKSRLRSLLSDAERRDLYFIMARKVIGALKATPGIERVFVVTTCSDVDRFATQLGATVIHQAEDKGTAAAFSHAVGVLLDSARRRRPDRLLMIAGDLPLVSPALLAPLVSRFTATNGVSILPDRKRIGTNALFCSPPDAIPPCFGNDSFNKHLSAASERGVPVEVIESEPLSLDIDVADDLALLRAHSLDTSDPVADTALRELLASLQPGLIAMGRENFRDAHST